MKIKKKIEHKNLISKLQSKLLTGEFTDSEIKELDTILHRVKLDYGVINDIHTNYKTGDLEDLANYLEEIRAKLFTTDSIKLRAILNDVIKYLRKEE